MTEMFAPIRQAARLSAVFAACGLLRMQGAVAVTPEVSHQGSLQVEVPLKCRDP